MHRGYVAFLDVLGFSSLIADDRGDRIGQYLQCLKGVFGGMSPASPVRYLVFSDSIILTTPQDEIEALRHLIERCSVLLNVMLENNIALRGAIAFGPYIAEETDSGTFVAGKAIVEAYRFESEQDWVGIMLAPSIRERVPDLASLCRQKTPSNQAGWDDLHDRVNWAAFAQPANIPFRTGGTFDGFAVVPTDGSTEFDRVRDSIRANRKHLGRLKSIAPDPRAQAKYERSMEWLDVLQRSWAAIVTQYSVWQKIPHLALEEGSR